MKTVSLLIALLLWSGIALAQDKYTISGYVREASSGEELIGVSVYIQGTKIGTTSNGYGFYSLTIPSGDYTISYSRIGYDTKEIEISLTENITTDAELTERPVVLEPTRITAERSDENVKMTAMGTFKLRPSKIEKIPILFGEQDILKTIQLMPGVKSAREAGTGYSVRGGTADQNLILLDEAIVYHASHMLGFFSVFNSDAIKDVSLIKGTASSEYGGRLSSVLDIVATDSSGTNSERPGVVHCVGPANLF